MILIEPGQQEQLPDKCYGKRIGGSIAIFIDPESDLISALGLQILKTEDAPDKVPLSAKKESGKHGAYGAIWNHQRQGEHHD